VSVDLLEKEGGRRPSTEAEVRSRGMAELVASSLESELAAGGVGPVRMYRLYNRCSMKYVRIAGTRVDAAASHHDIYCTSPELLELLKATATVSDTCGYSAVG